MPQLVGHEVRRLSPDADQASRHTSTGFFGGMGGCAMIGQTMINVKVSGARTDASRRSRTTP
ncbi:hypothetical protein AB0N60_36195 [Streptomyces microflavus]|uniref:hypothetical protein n=1 Tax=Streptomyces microflavus TaxID=1919 RepID=UPI003439ACAC